MRIVKKILLFSFLLHVSFLNAQDTIVEYYNSDYKKVKKIKKASIIKKIVFDDNIWKVYEYSIDGKLRLTENYTDKKLNDKTGKSIKFYGDGSIDYEIEFKNRLMHGTGKWYFKNGQLSSKKEFLEGKRTTLTFWNEKGEKIDSIDAEYPPTFNGGDIEAFYKWMEPRIIYPGIAKENGFKGEQVFRIYVDENGKAGVDEIIKSVHYSIDDEIKKMIEESPQWKPGKKHGRFYKYTFDITLTYNLN